MADGPLAILAIPTFGTVSTGWTQQFKHIQNQLGSVIVDMFDERPGVNIAEKRNHAVSHAINTDARTLIFLGDDVFPPLNFVLQFLDWWRRGYKAVTGVYWTKNLPLQPYLWKGYLDGPFFDWKAGEFVPIDWAGCDCLMLDVQMLRDMGGPWFSLDYNMFPNQNQDPLAPQCQATTEDLFFYSRLKEQKVQLWADTSMQCLHEDRQSHVRYGLVPGMPQWPDTEIPAINPVQSDGLPQGLLIADIGASGAPQPLDQKNKVVRFDIDPSLPHIDVPPDTIISFGPETDIRPTYRCDVRKIPAGDGVLRVHS